MAAALVVLRLAVVVGALLVVAGTVRSAVRTFVLPRAVRVPLSRAVFVALRKVFDHRARRRTDYEGRDAVMAGFAPIGLLALPVVWLGIVFVCFAAIFGALAPEDGASLALQRSGSYLFTLGVSAAPGLGANLFGYLEAGLGLGLLALLITYLPSMYAAFSRRETLVSLLDVRAGTPPTPQAMLLRLNVIGLLHDQERMDQLWSQWETWFVEIEESHTSLGPLAFFRSPDPERSWVTASACVLDTATITICALDAGPQAAAQLCLRAGYLALRRIAASFDVPFDPDPAPTDPVSVSRSELEEVLDALAAAGLAVRAERDQVWRDFQGWRVNYDAPLLALASLTMAPTAPWSSDRSLRFRAPLRSRRSAR